ncbi:unnamed protein product [Auanema sp. JU1783]|nr:unnamed protein product [Auanema sp. JU1783]
MTSYGSFLDTSEDNKENIPFPHLVNYEKMSVVLPPNRDSIDDIDVVTVASDPVLNSPTLSQLSNASAVSAASASSPSVSNPLRRESSDEMDDCEDGEGGSRKDKSLGLLCQRFLIAMNEETRDSIKKEVHLESVARKMNVEKRRIYDIVNVMEALDAMSKTNKSFYRWQGLDNLPKLMAELQTEAVAEHLPERVMQVEQAMCSFTELSPSRKPGKDSVGSLQDNGNLSGSQSFGLENFRPQRPRVDGRDRQGRNSLAQLCRRFLMVLLSNPKDTRRVSLDVASTVLIKDPETEGFEPPSRSRCRRLYDIANVLVALGLIKKVHYLFGTKKIPLFVYCGPEPDENGTYDANACLEKMLTSSASAPQTPQMKATTAAMVQSLTAGKRSHSDADLVGTMEGIQKKMPRMKSEQLAGAASSLMMFAELAAERLRQEKEYATQVPTSTRSPLATISIPLTPTSKPKQNRLIPKPEPQRNNGPSYNVPPMNSPMTSKRAPMKVQNDFPLNPLSLAGLQSIVLPNSPLWSSLVASSLFAHKVQSAQPSPTLTKHSVSNILGNSNKVNVTSSLDHKQSSPFQVVKKTENAIPKTPFGVISNIPGRY